MKATVPLRFNNNSSTIYPLIHPSPFSFSFTRIHKQAHRNMNLSNKSIYEIISIFIMHKTLPLSSSRYGTKNSDFISIPLWHSPFHYDSPFHHDIHHSIMALTIPVRHSPFQYKIHHSIMKRTHIPPVCYIYVYKTQPGMKSLFNFTRQNTIHLGVD